MNSTLDKLSDWLHWVLDRWSISATPSGWAILLALAVIGATITYRPVWVILRHGVTIVHEMGHVVMGWLWGRRIEGISLHTDTSGLTITAGRPRGLGVLMTYLAGYPSPALVGLGLIWASTSGWSGAALTLVVLLLLQAFWLVRNIFGLVTVSIALALSGWVLYEADPKIVTTFTVVVGIFLLLSAARGAFDLWSLHARGGSEADTSDASMAARHSLLPAKVWVVLFGAFAGTCAFYAGGMLVVAITG